MKPYRLANGGVECDDRGLFIGGVALLKRLDTGAGFEPLAIETINSELSRRYGAPVDAGAKLRGFEFVASCLGRGELTLAQIGALMLRFPDPPLTAPKRPEEVRVELAVALDAAGLLKDDDFDEKHPRTGEPPNRAWFAPKPKNELATTDIPEPPAEPEAPGWRRWAKSALAGFGRSGRFGAFWMRALAVAAERISFLLRSSSTE